MRVELIYIFHNCFILQLEQKTFLFDYPADNYLNDTMRAMVISKIKDRDLYIFSSHGHPDHFNNGVVNLGSYSRTITYILSKDIVKKFRQYRENPSSHIAASDQIYPIDDFEVQTFRSNDLGVAFLIRIRNLNIYFGGDLANWDWDELTKEEHQLLVDYFGEVLLKLKKWPIQIAFSNTDQRLKNWAGAAQFIETLKPNLFVPMHTFGETKAIAKFLTENPNLPTKVFTYQKTGDTLIFELQ